MHSHTPFAASARRCSQTHLSTCHHSPVQVAAFNPGNLPPALPALCITCGHMAILIELATLAGGAEQQALRCGGPGTCVR
jgi:hypothetical protein